jgi:hypothetical protein
MPLPESATRAALRIAKSKELQLLRTRWTNMK